MKLKTFLNMGMDNCDHVEILKNKEKIYVGFIKDYLSNKKSINGVIESWFMYSDPWNYYPVILITLKTENNIKKKLDNKIE